MYQLKQDEKPTTDLFGYLDRNTELPSRKPIEKIFINFDKDIAAKMFGYRIRF